VPHTYVHNVLSTAADEFASVRQQILEDDDIPRRPNGRVRRPRASERLASIVETAYRDKAMADDKELREAELRLRETATRVRSGAAALRQ
jgi:hypothetical protein